MKAIKFFSAIITICLLLGVTTSCSDNDNKNKVSIGNQAGKLFSKIETTGTGDIYPYYTTFGYDGKKLTEAKRQDVDGNINEGFIYAYSDTKVSIYELISGRKEEYTLNKKGYVDFFYEDGYFAEYLYNSSGYLIKKSEEEIIENETKGREFTFSYRNGNKTKGTCTYYIKRDGKTYSEEPINYTYTYSKKENKSKIDIYDEEVSSHLFYYGASGLYGKASKNHMEKITITQGSEKAVVEFRYTFDSEGYVTNIVELYTGYDGKTSFVQYDITYN